MKTIQYLLLFLSLQSFAQTVPEKLSYHLIQTDKKGGILPWYDRDLGKSYNHTVQIVWNFWDTMRTDFNGLPYYMNHQVWTKGHNDPRGVGGDQVAMALSSWRLLYAYSGNERVLDNMKFMVDYYLSHSLSPSNCIWKNLPYPYNTLVYSGNYDGDMLLGKGFVQPDKAGSFGVELVNVYKLTGKKVYLDAAIDIANTLSERIVPGDNEHSPFPYRVNAITGKIGEMTKVGSDKLSYPYTSNWVGTMDLFRNLVSLGNDTEGTYQHSFEILLNWMKQYPLETNKWGPFFEDVGAWSNTQINAVTFARFILENSALFPNWKEASRHVLDWVYGELKNTKWEKYGVSVVNEQTSYRIPGNSHTARQGATELLYAAKTGDLDAKERGLRQLNWATYMVNDDGENTYPNNESWMTDGYGDYVRHYLRAMGAFPEIAPADQDHLLSSSSVVKKISYNAEAIQYETFDKASVEVLRLRAKPKEVKVNDSKLSESGAAEYWKWKSLVSGGVLEVNHQNGSKISIQIR